jgi:hypothetical protein
MKKTLLTIAATVAIATTAQADVTNPVHEAKAKDFMVAQYSLVEMSMACKLDTRFEYLEQVMDISYLKANASDEMSENIVNMWWGAMPFNPEVRNDKALEFTKVVKANRDHPEIVKGCADFSKQMDEVLDAWKSK